jgi:hypothetical protein
VPHVQQDLQEALLLAQQQHVGWEVLNRGSPDRVVLSWEGLHLRLQRLPDLPHGIPRHLSLQMREHGLYELRDLRQQPLPQRLLERPLLHPRKLLHLLLSVVLDELLVPEQHEEVVQEVVGRLEDARVDAAHEEAADHIQQLADDRRTEDQLGVVRQHPGVHAEEIFDEVAVAVCVLCEVADGYFAEVLVDGLEHVAAALELGEDGEGDFDEVDEAADGVFSEDDVHLLEQLAQKKGKVIFDDAHDVLEHPNGPLHIGVLVVLLVRGVVQQSKNVRPSSKDESGHHCLLLGDLALP